MAFVMFAVLAGFVITTYFLDKRDFISPRFLLCLALFASYCLIMLNYYKWDVNINEKFMLYISSAIVAFITGGFIVKLFTKKPVPEAVCNRKLPLGVTNIRYKYPANFLMIISVMFATVYVLKLLSDADGSRLGDRLNSIYVNIVSDGYTPGFIINQMREIVVAITYVSTFRLMQKVFTKHDKISIIKLLIPIIMFLMLVLVSTDRNILLRYAIYFVCLYILFFRENKKCRNVNVAILLRVIIIVVVVAVVFFAMGVAKGYKSDIWRSISIYGGSGLYNFNLWLEKAVTESGSVISATFSTFLGVVKDLLGRIGISLDIDTAERFDEFIRFTTSSGYHYDSNIYSAFKPFVQDLGYFGVILFPLIIGAFYQWLYLRARKNKYGFSWVVYCMLIYPVVFYPVAEQLFHRFTLGFVYEIVWLAVVFFVVYGRRGYKTVYRPHKIKKSKEVQA